MNYLRTPLHRSLYKYGLSLMHIAPLGVAVTDRLTGKPGNLRKVSVRSGERFTVRSKTADLSEVVSVCLGFEYPAPLFDYINSQRIEHLFDFGAHIGTFAVHAARLCPRASIYAYEPEPHNYELLCTNIGLNQLMGRVRALPCAISDTNGTAILRISTSNNGHSLVAANQKEDEGLAIKTESVQTALSRANGKAFAIKMDIEGFEYRLIEKCGEDIAKASLVILEWHFSEGAKAERYKYLQTFFARHSFTPHRGNSESHRTLLFSR